MENIKKVESFPPTEGLKETSDPQSRLDSVLFQWNTKESSFYGFGTTLHL